MPVHRQRPVTGDSLGPLVGGELFRRKAPGIYVYGTLEHPVHALNLEEHLADLALWHPRALVIAVDASLGCSRHQQHISVAAALSGPAPALEKASPMWATYLLRELSAALTEIPTGNCRRWIFPMSCIWRELSARASRPLR